MMLARVLLAQVATATPRPAPTATPRHEPVEIGKSAPPAEGSLAGAARGRKIDMSAFGTEIALATPALGPNPTAKARYSAKELLDEMNAEERKWRDRATALRTEMAAPVRERDAIAEKIPTYTWTNRNGSQVALTAERDAAIAPCQVKIDRLKAELDGLPEECRKAGCQPGWVR